MYNVFVSDPVTGRSVTVLSERRVYDASALANHFTDAGYHVETDLWGDVVPNAMVSPSVWLRHLAVGAQVVPLIFGQQQQFRVWGVDSDGWLLAQSNAQPCGMAFELAEVEVRVSLVKFPR